jgi:hypothetical protein
MHNFICVAYVAVSIMLLPGANASAGIAATNLLADATFRGPNLAAPDLPQARTTSTKTDHEDELLAAIVSAHISEPDRVTGVLTELRVESIGHLGRLDLEEWSEMMAGMRIGGVALGSRNKLRLLVAARSASAGARQTSWVDGPRRVQELQAEKASSRTDKEGDSTFTEQASQQESTNKPTGTTFGVSGDGAPRPPQSDYCAAHLCIVALHRARRVAGIDRGVCSQ